MHYKLREKFEKKHKIRPPKNKKKKFSQREKTYRSRDGKIVTHIMSAREKQREEALREWIES